MREPSSQKKREDMYVLDPEDMAEMLRLMRQDELVNQGMGGLFPELQNQLPSQYKRIIDMGCGPGNWVLNVAYEYLEVEVVGIDISKLMIRYAQTQARTEERGNALFVEGNLLKPLPFDDASFDLVNARFMTGFVPRKDWPAVVQEFFRILRPGGMLRLTEIDTGGISNSAALEEILSLTTRMMHQLGYGFSPNGHSFGMTPMLGKFLRDVGGQEIQHQAHAIDFSYGTEFHQSQYEDWRSGFLRLLPVLMKCGLTTDEAFTTLYEQMQQEMLAEDFRGIWYILTAWGRKG